MRKEIIICSLIGFFIIIPTTSLSSNLVQEKEAIHNVGLRGLGDLQFMWGAEQQTTDYQTVGCECTDTHFYITGANSGSDPNKVYIFDFDGNYIDSFDQSGTTDWGWIDLAWDGQYLYGGRNDGIIDVFTTDGTIINQINAPVPWPVGLAYDSATDHLWTTDRFADTNFYEIDKDGNVINTLTNTKLIYGLAWDDVCDDGPYLWCAAYVEGGPECTFHQFDPVAGDYTGVSFEAEVPEGTASNRCCGLGFTTDWNTSAGILFGIQQCDQLPDGPGDQIAGYEICEIGEPEPELCCSGSLTWSDVKPGSIVEGEFYVENCGDDDSELNWEVSAWPVWGTDWYFDPPALTGQTPDYGLVTVYVRLTAPSESEKEFTGKIEVVNTDDISEFCEIDVNLVTPKSKSYKNTLFYRILEHFSNTFPILKYLMRL